MRAESIQAVRALIADLDKLHAEMAGLAGQLVWLASALTGTDPPVLNKTDPLCAQVFVTRPVVTSWSARQGVTSRCDGSAQPPPSVHPFVRLKDHPSVPTCPLWGVAASGGQGWPKATASAARSVLDGRSPQRQAGGKVRTSGDCWFSGMAILSRKPHRRSHAKIAII